jgi:hypothetical protein
MAEKNPADLGVFRAIIDAILGRDISFYPRVAGEKCIQTLTAKPMQDELDGACAGWDALSASDLEPAIALARQSLDEVKEQTEYQDQKVGRLLTVATILSALSGLLLTRFNDAYPLRATLQRGGVEPWIVLAGYAVFAAFVICVLFGALVTFHATRTRFKYKSAPEEAAAEEGPPESRLFYKPMLRVRPAAWARSFVTTQVTAGRETLVLYPSLRQLYFRDLVTEAYLVAAKTADKIRYLESAQRLLSWALRWLLAWLVIFAIVSFLPPTAPPAKPTQVELMSMPPAARDIVVTLRQSQPFAAAASVSAETPAKTPASATQQKGRRQ